MNKQSGFTLIELMIAGFIGIFIFTGLLNLLITTNKSVTLSDSLSQNQETGRFTMNYLTSFVRRAGYTEDFTAFTPPLFIESGENTDSPITCTGNQADVCALNNPITNPVTMVGDRLSIPMDIGGDNGDEIRSCTGTIIGGNGAWANSGPQRIVNVFWVSATADNNRQLLCRTFNRNTNNWIENQAVSIINNIERLEFQVGIASDAEESSASRYVSVNTITDDSTITMDFIRSIRISILTTSQDDLNNDSQSTLRERSYGLLDAPEFTIKDRNLRNVFTNTIELPNMIGPRS